MTVTLEVCVESLEGAVAAVEVGAQRLELCSALCLGGLTPSIGLFKMVKMRLPHVAIHVLIRPRAGDFVYTAAEMKVAVVDADVALEAGSDGIVFGCLTPGGDVDVESLDTVLQTCPTGEGVKGARFTFHRAFDFVRNTQAALEVLMERKVERLLTSGGAATALQGVECLKRLVSQAEGRLVVMAGGGIRSNNVAAIVRQSGVREVHSSCSMIRESAMVFRNPNVALASGPLPGLWEVQATDPTAVAALLEGLTGLS